MYKVKCIKKILFIMLTIVLIFVSVSNPLASPIDVEPLAETEAFSFAIFSASEDMPLDLSGKDRYIEGSVYSNNNVEINAWNVNITGLCQTSGKILEHSINNKIGQKIEGASKPHLPDMFESLKKKTISGGKVFDGDKSLSQETVDCSGNIYIKGNIVLDNCTILGTGFILAEGNITIVGNNKYTDDSSKAILYSKAGDIDVRGTGHEVNGTLYAPMGKVVFNGAKQTIIGKVIGKEILFNNKRGLTVIYEESNLDDLLIEKPTATEEPTPTVTPTAVPTPTVVPTPTKGPYIPVGSISIDSVSTNKNGGYVDYGSGYMHRVYTSMYISGVVYDNSRVPVPNSKVLITFYNRSTYQDSSNPVTVEGYTDASGVYRINVPLPYSAGVYQYYLPSATHYYDIADVTVKSGSVENSFRVYHFAYSIYTR